MGMYDTIEIDNREGQVKLWNCYLGVYKKNDPVPVVLSVNEYSIAMREGGFVNIVDNIIVSWTDRPESTHIFDKWGDKWKNNSSGLIGKDYLYEKN